MGETRDHLEAHGGPGMVLCGITGTFIAHSAMCEECPRRLCEAAQPGSTACAECLENCPDWQPDDDREPDER